MVTCFITFFLSFCIFNVLNFFDSCSFYAKLAISSHDLYLAVLR